MINSRDRRDEVGLAEQIVLAHIADAGLLAFLRRQVLAPGNHLHAEGLSDGRGAGAELAEAKNAQGHAFEIGADGGLPLGAGVQPRVLVADMAGQFEHQPDGDAGSRTAERAGAADRDAARLGRLGVDRGVAHACGDQEFQVGERVDHSLGKAGALAHGDDDLEPLQGRDNLVRSAEVLVEDFEIDVAFDLRPIGAFEDHVLIVVENCAANGHSSSTPRDGLSPETALGVP